VLLSGPYGHNGTYDPTTLDDAPDRHPARSDTSGIVSAGQPEGAPKRLKGDMTIAWDDLGTRPLPREGAAVNADERDAFDDFVRARLPHLVRFGWMLTGSRDAGSDLVHDALERTLLHWRRLDSRSDPEAYVRRVMVNRNISIWRKRRREVLTDQVRDAGHDDDRRDHDMWRAIQQLPPKQRAVVVLRYYEDLSESDIARILGCSAGTVKSQASKALGKLRESTSVLALHDPAAGDRTHGEGEQ
jgi:RNA polymerase sigma-70 factor (sigma-E family)